MEKEEQIFDNLVSELRRGTMVLSILSQLNKPQYGYSLVILLEEKGLIVDPGTLYPLLRRLEKQEILTSTWNTETSKPRKYYKISDFGQKIYKRLCEHWLEISKKVNNFINEGEI